MPNVDSCALKRLAIGASDRAEDVSVGSALLEYPDDGGAVGLRGDSSTVEGAEDGGGSSVDVGFRVLGVLNPAPRRGLERQCEISTRGAEQSR